jgi:hypothetical protein
MDLNTCFIKETIQMAKVFLKHYHYTTGKFKPKLPQDATFSILG